MTTSKITFTKNGQSWIATFKVTAIPTINIKKSAKGDILISQKTSDDTNKNNMDFAPTYNLQNVVGTREVEIVGYNFPKYVQIISFGDDEPTAYYSYEEES